jgi:hypothetical protein
VDSCGFKVAYGGGEISCDWNQFYRVFITVVKNMTEEAKIFGPSS